MTSRRVRAIIRRRRIRRERHSWRFVSGGLVAAIITGWVVSSLSGQAAAQAAEEGAYDEQTLVQADWKVDTVLADMAAAHAAEEAERERAAAEAAAREAEEQAAAEAEAEAEAQAEAEAAEAEAEARAEAEAEAANPWSAPSEARITSYYGMRNGSMHGGTDFGNNMGDEISTVGAGTVSYVGFEAGGYGNVVYIDHGDGVQTRYAHASEVLVNVGDEVAEGDTIMLAGTTGNSTGPHLHFEVLIDDEKVDSLSWLEEQGVDVG